MIETIFRVVRGGSWNHYSANLRAAYRSYFPPANRCYSIGFRLVVRIKDE